MKIKVFFILAIVLAGCSVETPEGVNESNGIVFYDPPPFDYNSYVIEPNTELLTISDTGREVGMYVDSNGLIEIRYKNCTPHEGAKVVYRVVTNYWGKPKDPRLEETKKEPNLLPIK